jgi:hypothetical protein
MRNPWLSLWLSAYFRNAGYAQAQTRAWMARQQRAFFSQAWAPVLAFWTPAPFRHRTSKRSRRRRA